MPGGEASAIGLAGEASRELGGHLGIGESFCTRFRDDDEVGGWTNFRLASPEHLAEEPLHAVSDDRVADSLAHGDAEARARPRRRSPQNDEVRRVAASCVPLQVQILDTATDTGRLREALGPHDEVNRAASEEC